MKTAKSSFLDDQEEAQIESKEQRDRQRAINMRFYSYKVVFFEKVPLVLEEVVDYIDDSFV